MAKRSTAVGREVVFLACREVTPSCVGMSCDSMFVVAGPVCRTIHLLSVSLDEALKALVLATVGFVFVLKCVND